VDDGDDVGAGLGMVIAPARRVILLLTARRRPTVDRVGATGVGQAGSPQVDVLTGQMRVLLVPGTRRLPDVIGPHIPRVATTARISRVSGQRSRPRCEPNNTRRDNKTDPTLQAHKAS